MTVKLSTTIKNIERDVPNLKNRWASITEDNDINLNVNLIKAPPEIIDYIIIHELCHFKIKGHSYNFCLEFDKKVCSR